MKFLQKYLKSNNRAVQMSVTMIVILIIAIVALGLIISFIRVFFGKATVLVGDQFKQVSDELERKCEQSASTVCLNSGNKITVVQGEPQDEVFAIRNTGSNPNGDASCYVVGVFCERPNEFGAECSLDRGNDIYVGGRDLTDASGNTFVEFDSWVTSITSAARMNVDNQGVRSGFMRLAVPAARGIYNMKFEVWRAAGGEDCSNAGDFTRLKSNPFTLEVQ